MAEKILILILFFLLAQLLLVAVGFMYSSNELFIIYATYYSGLIFAILTLGSLLWLVFIIRHWIVKCCILVFLGVLGCCMLFLYGFNFLMLPERTKQVALAPNKQYKAIVYNRGVVDVYPLLVVEGINLTPKIIYEGPENDILSYKWLSNETLEVKTAPDGATDPNPYSKPFIVSIKDNK